MIPVSVTFKLATPLIEDSYRTHLDALVAWAVYDKYVAEGGDDDSHLARLLDSLPLEERDGVWTASALYPEDSRPGGEILMTRRLDLVQIAADQGVLYSVSRNTLPSGTGPYRAYMMTHPRRTVTALTAYALTSDVPLLKSLLGRVRAIGKIRRNGHGTVIGLTVREEPLAADLWRARTLPQSASPLRGLRYEPAYETVRPPYWVVGCRVPARRPCGISVAPELRSLVADSRE